MNLSQVQIGECAAVIRMHIQEEIKERLKMLNVYENAKIKVIGRSLFKSSLLLEVEGIKLGLRRELAEKIEVVRL